MIAFIAPGRLLARTARLIAVMLSMLTAGAAPAFAQTPAPQPGLGLQEQGTPPPQPPQRAEPASPGAAPGGHENPGLINEMGRLFDRIVPNVKSPGETLDDLNARTKDAAKEAGDAFSRLIKTGSMVTGRALCPPAANGTPDCKAGADKLCQSKGFKEGKSLNIDAAQSCSAKVLIPGRTRKPDDCHTDNYVTSALCE